MVQHCQETQQTQAPGLSPVSLGGPGGSCSADGRGGVTAALGRAGGHREGRGKRQEGGRGEVSLQHLAGLAHSLSYSSSCSLSAWASIKCIDSV